MRRWRNGTTGAMKMGLYHGLYCLGCCWPYFLIMIDSWMDEPGVDGFILTNNFWRKNVEERNMDC